MHATSLLAQYANCLWKPELDAVIAPDLIPRLSRFLETERRQFTVYPSDDQIFAALNLCPLQNTRVVLIGQDPYHGPGQAHGLAFSVRQGVTSPPSLRNMLKELRADLGDESLAEADLSAWATQGVLLLNAVLSVRDGQPGSHANKGWEQFTDAVIKTVSDRPEHCVFLLLGNYAAKKAERIDAEKHTIVQAAHPSPLSASRGFFGSKVFSRVNAALSSHHQPTIHW
jgi:uracil-DNA glycosylase